MTTQETYDALCDHARETAIISSIQGILGWDEQTYMPPAAGEYRAEQSAYLAGVIHRRRTSPELGDLLSELVDSPLAAETSTDAGCVIRQLKRDYDKKTRLPASLVEEQTRTSSLAQQAWRQARKADDFASYRPWLEKTLNLKRQEAEALGYKASPYDPLLDDYEPGEVTERVTRVLAGLREQLAPLVQSIAESHRKAPIEILKREFPIAQQAAFGHRAAEAIGLDFQAGRLDVTAHPFCGGGGPRDVRLTTRYDAHNFADGFFSILHETGHGLYEQGLRSDQFGLPTGEAVSLGIHESQSRMWENSVGRSRAFWERFLPEMAKTFPESMAGVALDDFYFAVNESKPSLIRTESDEATYNLHIIVRFELEQSLLSGDLKVADLPDAWRGKYAEYLGITPPNDADGVMQDVHWSAGLIGYFPTYSLGNLYAAQFFEAARNELGDLDAQFRQGEFQPLRQWLQRHIHEQGQRYTAAELVERVTGEPLSYEPLIRHLKTKFGELYELVEC